MSYKRRAHTSGTSEKQWKRLKWMLPKSTGAGGPVEFEIRQVINAFFSCLSMACSS